MARAEVLAVTTHTRALSNVEAATVVHEDILALRAAGAKRVYKKVDSTLRGPFRAEIEAARKAWRDDAIAIVCPAFPDMGRTVSQGILLVDGQPVTQTSAGTDPVTPVTESHVPTLLGAAHVKMHESETPQGLAARLLAAGDTVVVDAIDNRDIERLAAAIVMMGERALPVGSGGLALPLARLWAGAETQGPVIVVVTSQHSEARHQADALCRAGAQCCAPTAEELADTAAWQGYIDRVVRAAAVEPPGATWFASRPLDMCDGLSSDAVADRLGELAARFAVECRGAGVVATGGDGASAVLHALGANGIALVVEVTSGMPLGTLTGGKMPGLPIVTKAGGFGAADVLIKAAKAVRERRFPV